MISGAAFKSSSTGLIIIEIIIVELAEYETFFVTICVLFLTVHIPFTPTVVQNRINSADHKI